MKTLLRILFLILFICGFVQSELAQCTEVDSSVDIQKRWEKLSDNQKQRLRQNYDRWKAMPQEKQSFLKENFKRFRELRSEDRQRVVQRFQLFGSLPPERQQKVKDRFQQFMNLPHAERTRRMERLKDFKRQGDAKGPAMRGAEPPPPPGSENSRPPREAERPDSNSRWRPDRMRDPAPRPFRQGEGPRNGPEGKGVPPPPPPPPPPPH